MSQYDSMVVCGLLWMTLGGDRIWGKPLHTCSCTHTPIANYAEASAFTIFDRVSIGCILAASEIGLLPATSILQHSVFRHL